VGLIDQQGLGGGRELHLRDLFEQSGGGREGGMDGRPGHISGEIRFRRLGNSQLLRAA
jgi:hypothetical protein